MMKIDDVFIERTSPSGMWLASTIVGGYRVHVRFDRKPSVSKAREAIRERYLEMRAGF